jgi:DNA-binding NarL/FixJ family response regulator
LFEPLGAELPNTVKKEQLYLRYQITSREQEVIEQICLGKTNQQIADTLFISLQTVKDHTHRIYTKVGINSRMKLVQMLNA